MNIVIGTLLLVNAVVAGVFAWNIRLEAHGFTWDDWMVIGGTAVLFATNALVLGAVLTARTIAGADRAGVPPIPHSAPPAAPALHLERRTAPRTARAGLHGGERRAPMDGRARQPPRRRAWSCGELTSALRPPPRAVSSERLPAGRAGTSRGETQDRRRRATSIQPARSAGSLTGGRRPIHEHPNQSD